MSERTVFGFAFTHTRHSIVLLRGEKGKINCARREITNIHLEKLIGREEPCVYRTIYGAQFCFGIASAVSLLTQL